MPKSRQPGNAFYTIRVPTHDPHGNQLQDLTQHGVQEIAKLKRAVHDVHTEGPYASHPYRHIKVLAVDSPEVDSHVKSIAADIARMAAHPSVFISKQSPQGIFPWTIGNKSYDGQPADASVHMPEPIPQATVAPSSYPTYP